MVGSRDTAALDTEADEFLVAEMLRKKAVVLSQVPFPNEGGTVSVTGELREARPGNSDRDQGGARRKG